MFEPRFATLSDRYHLLAPDYPPLRTQRLAGPYGAFAYTFDRYAEIVNRFTEALGLRQHTLYMQDYGGPVGFRMLLAHPEVVPAEAWKECRGRLRASQNKRNANIRNRAPAPGPPLVACGGSAD